MACVFTGLTPTLVDHFVTITVSVATSPSLPELLSFSDEETFKLKQRYDFSTLLGALKVHIKCKSVQL